MVFALKKVDSRDESFLRPVQKEWKSCLPTNLARMSRVDSRGTVLSVT